MNLATNASLAMQERGGTLEISLTDIDFASDSPLLEADLLPGEFHGMSSFPTQRLPPNIDIQQSFPYIGWIRKEF